MRKLNRQQLLCDTPSPRNAWSTSEPMKMTLSKFGLFWNLPISSSELPLGSMLTRSSSPSTKSLLNL